MEENPEPVTTMPIALHGLRGAFGRMPLVVLGWLATLLLSLAAAVPWLEWFTGTLAHRYAPGSLRSSLDEVFRVDHRDSFAELDGSGAALGGMLALLAMLLGVFQAGGWLQVVLERTEGHSVRRFLWGGSRYFWRFLRVWLLTLLVLALATWLCFDWPWKRLFLELFLGLADGDVEHLKSEAVAVRLGWFQDGLYAALVALVLAWADFTRTRLALRGTHSVLWAGLATFGLLARYPVRTLRPLLALLVLEMLVVAVAGHFAHRLNIAFGAESTWLSLVLLASLGQFALLSQAFCRGARYYAAVETSRALVRPLAKKDPWARRVGGPGGPQYPIDDQDEFGVLG
jgi:hypothetical protein